MNKNKKQRIFIVLAILAVIFAFASFFGACKKVGASKQNYTVTIHPNNGQAEIVWDLKTDFPTITKDGYHIVGYYLEENFITGVTPESLKTAKLTKNVHVYVKWEKDGCNHTEVIDSAVEPTCTTTGLTEGKHCSDCGEILQEQTVIPSLGHDYSKEWTTDVQPTCTKNGSKSRHCIRCADKTEVTEVSALGHDLQHHEAKAPTCTNIGWNEYDECKRDGCDYTTYVQIDARHDFKTDGVCAVCGYFETGLSYSLSDDGTYYVVSGIGEFKGTELKIPSVNFDTKPVRGIGKNAFANCTFIESVTIPDSVTTIGENAFAECSSLERFIFGNGVQSIGVSAFSGCAKLKGVTIPDSVTDIGANAFTACVEITEIHGCADMVSIVAKQANPTAFDVYMTSGTQIGNYAFTGCAGLTYLSIPQSVVSIGKYAFSGCSQLANLEFTQNVTSIGNYAFYNCTSISEINLPDSVSTVGENAFGGCNKVTRMSGSANLMSVVSKQANPESFTLEITSGTTIGEDAFSYRAGLTAVTICDSVTSLAKGAFQICITLTDVTILGENLITMGDKAFFQCMELKNVSMPNSVTSIGTYAFSRCYALEAIALSSGITSISNCLFLDCKSLLNIVIPENVTSIGNSAFWGCEKLTGTIIGDKVTDIGSEAFSGCTALKTVNIPDSVTRLGTNAFLLSGIVNVTVPENVTYVGERVFGGCKSLVEVKWNAIEYETSGYTVFGGCDSLITINIGQKVKNIPSKLFSNCKKVVSVLIPDSVTIIDGGAFWGCDSLESVTLPDALKIIGDDAFYKCLSLTSVTIPDSVTDLGVGAFLGCEKLSSVIIGSGITVIEGDTFDGCKALSKLVIGSNVESIGDIAFRWCNALTSVTIPEKVKSIGQGAFYGCENLEKVNWNATKCETAGLRDYSVFNNCVKLTRINIGANVTSLPAYAFSKCAYLTAINYGGTTEQWNAIVKGEEWNFEVPTDCQINCVD